MSQEDAGNPSIVLFDELEVDFCNLLKNATVSLPVQYEPVMSTCKTLVTDLKRSRHDLVHLDNDSLYEYLVSLFVNELNQILQSLYDTAEDRVIHGNKINDAEVAFFTVIDGIYTKLINDVASVVQQQQDAVVVVSLNTELEESKLNGELSAEVELTAIAAAFVQNPNNDELSKWEIEEEQLQTFESTFINRSGEKLVKYGIVVQVKETGGSSSKQSHAQQSTTTTATTEANELSSSNNGAANGYSVSNSNSGSSNVTTVTGKVTKKRPRLLYFFLTNFQIVYTQLDFKLKGSVDLSSISKVSGKGVKFFTIAVGKEHFVFCSTEAADWVKAITEQKAEFMSIAESVRESSDLPHVDDQQPLIELTVHVKEVSDLRDPPKKRPHNPYFFAGVGNPEHFLQERISRYRSSVLSARSGVYDEKFTLRYTATSEFVLDIRFYSKVKGVRNDFAYGTATIDLRPLLRNSGQFTESISGWYPLKFDQGTQGQVFVTVQMATAEYPQWLLEPTISPFTSALSHFMNFRLSEKSPVIYGGPKNEVVAILKTRQSRDILLDSLTKLKIYSLEKSSFFKKEYSIADKNGNTFAKCFHKMKSFRKKKVRMFLTNGEWLFTMEGGCFNDKSYDNEVVIRNSCSEAVAAVVFVGTEKRQAKEILLSILDAATDKALVLLFALYILRTW